MSQKILKFLRETLDHLEYYNRMAPFPVYDSEYVAGIKTKLDEMTNKEINYDEMPVVACKHCMSLHVVTDEVENDICMRCGATNEIVIYETIDDYLEAKEAINE